MDMLKKQKVVTTAFECRYNEIITSYAMVNLQKSNDGPVCLLKIYVKRTNSDKKTCFKSVVCLL